MCATVEMSGICKAFDRIPALDSVSLDLAAGEVHALLGENGAGKTTLSNVLAGTYRADAGTVTIDGVVRQFHSPAQAIEAGIGMVHQHFQLVEPFTVAENIHLGWSKTPRRVSARRLVERTRDLMGDLGLSVDPTARVWQLSVGEQQRVEIVRVLARGARVLILDEPTAVLVEEETEELFALLRRLVDRGHTVVFISHKLHEVLSISDRITVLRGGRNVATCATSSMGAAGLAELMTGESTQLAIRRPGLDRGEPSLEVREITVRGDRGLVSVNELSATVHAREIVGVAGVAGNGQRELTEAIVGLRSVQSGRVTVGSDDMTGCSPRAMSEAGVGYLPEDRLGTALVSSGTVVENSILRNYRSPPILRRFGIHRSAARRFAQRLVDEGRVVVRDIDTPVAYMSGGNQQRLVARRECEAARQILVAENPTQGLDVRASQEVRGALLGLRDSGCGVLLVSEDLDEILAISDRILVIYDGVIVGEFSAETADRHQIGYLMGGGHRHDAESPQPGSARS